MNIESTDMLIDSGTAAQSATGERRRSASSVFWSVIWPALLVLLGSLELLARVAHAIAMHNAGH